MGKQKFKELMKIEMERLDSGSLSKRKERVIEGFTEEECPRALINGKTYLLFNSNDYLGLRFNKEIKKAEHEASGKYGNGPGAVRFISGTMEIHKKLEQAIANFHGREDAIIFSSAFAANFSILQALIKGQSVDSLISNNTLVVSDELNHRSIIEGIKVANLNKEQKVIFNHLDHEHLKRILEENAGRFARVVVVTDGIFSMLGEAQNLREIKRVIEDYDSRYDEGIFLVVDDAHGIGCFGESGRGCEEVFGVKCDVLVGTLGKSLGTDGGYATGDKIIIDYLRETASGYIYSNPIPPGCAAAALASIKLLDSEHGKELLSKLKKNIAVFKHKMKSKGFIFAADSSHAIQPLVIGDAEKARKLAARLFDECIVVTNINFPVVPKGRDEIRVQISALHSEKEIDFFVERCTECSKDLGII